MKIKFIDSIRTGHVTFTAGDEVDLPNAEANAYVQSGHAHKLPEGVGGDTESHDTTKIALSSANPPPLQTGTEPVVKSIHTVAAPQLDNQQPELKSAGKPLPKPVIVEETKTVTVAKSVRPEPKPTPAPPDPVLKVEVVGDGKSEAK